MEKFLHFLLSDSSRGSTENTLYKKREGSTDLLLRLQEDTHITHNEMMKQSRYKEKEEILIRKPSKDLHGPQICNIVLELGFHQIAMMDLLKLLGVNGEI